MLIPPVQSRGGDLGHWRGRAGGPLTRGLAGMRRAAGGNIVIMASEWGVIGWPDTRQLQVGAVTTKVSLADMHEEYSRGIPIGRIGRADEIAPAVDLLARKDVDAHVGQTIQVDGGTTRCRA